MSATSAIAVPNRTRLRVEMLDQWAEAGMAMARKLVSDSRRSLAEASRTFMRIAQAVRLATFLAMRLCDPTNPADQPTPAKPRAPGSAEPAPLAEKAETEPPKKHDREDRVGSDREISDDAILRRPLKDIVKVICRNLGIVPDWSLWSDDDEAPKASEGPAPPPKRPRPKPIRRALLRHGLFLQRALGRRLIWISPTGLAPTPPSLRTQLRSTASPLALDPTVPGRADASACPAVEEAPPLWSADVLVRTFARHITNGGLGSSVGEASIGSELAVRGAEPTGRLKPPMRGPSGFRA